MKNVVIVLLFAAGFCLPESAFSQVRANCPEMKVTYKVTHETNQLKNGEIKLTIDGGKAPYVVQWFSYNFSEDKKDIKNLKSGYYYVVIVDAAKCVKQIENIHVENISNKN